MVAFLSGGIDRGHRCIHFTSVGANPSIQEAIRASTFPSGRSQCTWIRHLCMLQKKREMARLRGDAWAYYRRLDCYVVVVMVMSLPNPLLNDGRAAKATARPLVQRWAP